MFVKFNCLAVNPFFDAYLDSDLLGRLIFIGLFSISVVTWILLIYKVWLAHLAKKNSLHFSQVLKENKINILSLEYPSPENLFSNPFLQLYQVLRKQTLDLLNKNRHFAKNHSPEEEGNKASYLSPTDINIVESHLIATIAIQTKELEKNLFVLSTIVVLAPFLGLLGTVWGILTTFSHLQTQSGGNTNQMVIGGLSLALATTVLGLVDAIPALIGYNYLRNRVGEFQVDMECFSNEILGLVEMQYRKVDVK